MGTAKRELERQHDQLRVAAGIALNAGVLKECEPASANYSRPLSRSSGVLSARRESGL